MVRDVVHRALQAPELLIGELTENSSLEKLPDLFVVVRQLGLDLEASLQLGRYSNRLLPIVVEKVDIPDEGVIERDPLVGGVDR